jgi:hypothetical protein
MPPPAQQRRIGGIDDRVDLKERDIRFDRAQQGEAWGVWGIDQVGYGHGPRRVHGELPLCNSRNVTEKSNFITHPPSFARLLQPSGTPRPIFMRVGQFPKHLVRDVGVAATLVSKPIFGAGSFARLYPKALFGMNVPNPDLGRWNVFAQLRRYSADAASRYLDEEAATVYIELERQ